MHNMWLGKQVEGGKLSFQNVGGPRYMQCINYYKSKGAKAHLGGGGERSLLSPLNTALIVNQIPGEREDMSGYIPGFPHCNVYMFLYTMVVHAHHTPHTH